MADFDFQHLVVTSKLDKPFKARFHGVDYEFKRGKGVEMPVEAAAHIFGFGEEDKTRALHRLGWLTTTEGMEAARERLDRIDFLPADQIIEIRRPNKARREALTVDGAPISNDRSPVNAGAVEEGPGNQPPDDGQDNEDDRAVG